MTDASVNFFLKEMMFQVVFPLLSQHSPLPWSSFDEQDFLVPETLQANVKLSTARPLCLSAHQEQCKNRRWESDWLIFSSSFKLLITGFMAIK